MDRPSVTDRDREHFRRIAEAKKAEEAERLREAALRHPVEKTDEATERLLDERALGQAELARRGRELGLRVDDE